MDASGRHLLIELKQCDAKLLDDLRYVEEAVVAAAAEAGVTIVGKTFHKLDPRGVTGIVAIAESHLSIHTWPDDSYAAMDIFICGTALKPRQAAQLIIERLRCSQPSITELERGPVYHAGAAAV